MLILPKTYVEGLDRPSIFLAGPIQAAGNWHKQAITTILNMGKEVVVVCPSARRSLYRDFSDKRIQGSESHFQRKSDWERYYLERSSRMGCILFWLAPRPSSAETSSKVFAATTRLELGIWLGKRSCNPALNLCFGAHERFPELDSIEYYIKMEAQEQMVHRTLRDVCNTAVEIATS